MEEKIYATFWIYSESMGVFGRLCAAEDALAGLEPDARLIPDKPDGDCRFDPDLNEWVPNPAIEPTPEEKRAMMPKLEKWRVDTVIDLETGLRDKINAAIATWPDPKRTIAKNKLASVSVFDRLDPLFDELGAEPEVGKTPDDIDNMWTAGAALPPALT
ncbi:hypothetical protein [Brucella intermedia]|uniref:hypothetical protein n=1 Tax=Brucella intermedia TaxID=94625 RepID=UPI0007C7C6D1|nr:hypothetical protein [Brucella intermedia]OAE43913.1 hypothetical protein A7J42_00545 [Brucella intermedia]